jgi:hypothetical protein
VELLESRRKEIVKDFLYEYWIEADKDKVANLVAFQALGRCSYRAALRPRLVSRSRKKGGQ